MIPETRGSECGSDSGLNGYVLDYRGFIGVQDARCPIAENADFSIPEYLLDGFCEYRVSNRVVNDDHSIGIQKGTGDFNTFFSMFPVDKNDVKEAACFPHRS